MDNVQEVREKTDIVQLISEYIPLKQAGHSFKANCPFHNEKTPSFVVSPERQIWHCFGCSKGGDVFSFLMEYEKLEFPEALRMLAKRAGVELKDYKGFDTKVSSKKELLYTINHLALQFYHYILTSHTAGEKAKAYLIDSRAVNPKLIDTFQIGYAPITGGALTSFLIKKGYKKQDLLDAGVSTLRQGKLQDFFVNRLMFPLIDHRDNVVGFSGRSLSNDSYGPKYVNTKETLVYRKGSHFFGLSVTKQEIKKKEQAIVVEGEFDVMRCFQAGVGNVVGLKGTALTDEQAALLSRFTKKITLCLDQDSAGQQAMVRSLPVLSKRDLTVTVISVPDGKDPDEAIKHNEYEFKQAVKQDQDVYDYLLQYAVSKADPKTAEGKKYISSLLLPLYGQIENVIVREHYLRRAAEALDTSFESIEKELQRNSKKPLVELKVHSPNQEQKKDRKERLTEYLLSLVIQYEPFAVSREAITSVLGAVSLGNTPEERILERVLSAQTAISSQDIARDLPTELLPIFDTCFLFPLPEFSDQRKYLDEIKKTAILLRSVLLREQLKTVSQKLQEEQEQEVLLSLQKQYATLTGQLKQQKQ